MNRSRVLVGCLAAGSAIIGWAITGAEPAGAEPATQAEAVEILERAREGAQTQPFEGVVAVQWRDGRERYTENVAVRNAGGVLRFGDEVVGAGAHRMVRGADGWLSLWGHDVARLGPSPADKYRLFVAPGPDVAARPTDVLSVQRVGETRPRERLYVDRQSGLLLRRELLDARGDPYRSVAFARISSGAAFEVATVAGTPRAIRSAEPAPTRHLRAPYKLPGRIGAGYHRVGAYRSGGVVQQFYSDGLHGLSVFEQRGQLSKARTGLAGEAGSGRRVEIAGRTMLAYSASVGEAAVWESAGVVFTAVTDAPWSDLAEAVRDLPHGDPPGRLRRVAQAVVSLFRWS